MSYTRIPIELRRLPQWIAWRYEVIINDKGEAKETKIPLRPLDGRLASVNNPLDWTSFQFACSCVDAKTFAVSGIGFVFTKSDPFTGIDLDSPDGDIQILERQERILATLNSYAERSPSGKGLHIIVEAALPGNGRRQGKIECYDALRFFTFTGDVYCDLPIAKRQDETIAIYNTLGSNVTETTFTGFEPEIYSDHEICDKAAAAQNGDKFLRLWSGNWETDYGNRSQSEADFALIDIIGFYSRNLAQTTRIFRQSGLGLRDKAKRGKYVETMVKRSFDRLLPKIEIETPPGDVWFDAHKIAPWNPKISEKLAFPDMVMPAWQGGAVAVTAEYPTIRVQYDTPEPAFVFPAPLPPMEIPGLVGMLVRQAWEAAPFQVAEVALASALSAMSMLSARSFRHGSLGLSLYLLVLAKTSTGKSFGYKANDNWQNALMKHYRSFTPPHNGPGKLRADMLEHMIIGEIGSAQGLAQHMPKAPSTLFHADEYVDAIKEMARVNPSPHVAQMKSELLRLMEMSGPGRVYRGRKYSQRSATAPESVNVFMASLTILATGTPEAFYDDMSASLLTSGFLPRFTILEYEGGLTRRNPNLRQNLDPAMMRQLCSLFEKGYDIGEVLAGDDSVTVDVQPRDAAAAAKLDWFDHICYREIQAANDASKPTAGLWSRAKEHVRQIASLIAIGCNIHAPAIDVQHVDIAMAIVRPTLEKITAKVSNGETGLGDERLEAEVKKAVVKLMTRAFNMNSFPNLKYGLLDQGYIQMSVLRNICVKLAPFRAYRLGSSAAFEATIQNMSRYGALRLADVNGLRCCQPNAEHFQQG